LDLRAGEHTCGFARSRHPDALVEPAGGGVIAVGPDTRPLVAQRAGCVENVEDKRSADACSLRSGVHEDHRDMQKRRIELALTVIEAARLGERHAYDFWSKRHERQGIWGREFLADAGGALRPVRSASGDVRRAPHADRSLELIGKHAADAHLRWVPLEGRPDEGALVLGVGIAVVSVPLGELTLQHRVATCDPRVGSESIAEGQLVAIALRTHRDEVQVMGALSRMRLAEPVHLLGQVGRVEIAEIGKGLEASSGCLKVGYASEDVDDRLCFETGDRRAADVVDAATDPLTDDPLQRYALQLESSRPVGVGRDESDGFVCRQGEDEGVASSRSTTKTSRQLPSSCP